MKKSWKRVYDFNGKVLCNRFLHGIYFALKRAIRDMIDALA